MRPLRALTRRVTPILAWVFLLAGIVIIGGTLLLPPFLEVQELRSKRDLMRKQAARMMEQSQRYEQMLFALESEDPILLERLAYHQFRLKPQRARVFDTVSNARQAIEQDSVGVESWLHLEMPTAVDEPMTPPFAESRWIQLAQGRRRVLLFAVGGLCLMIGLYTRSSAELAEADVLEDDDEAEAWEDAEYEACEQVACEDEDEQADVVDEAYDEEDEGGTEIDDDDWDEADAYDASEDEEELVAEYDTDDEDDQESLAVDSR